MDVSVVASLDDGGLRGSCLQWKYYSRDFLVPGRVRVQLFKPDGTPINSTIPNSKLSLPGVATERFGGADAVRLTLVFAGLQGKHCWRE